MTHDEDGTTAGAEPGAWPGGLVGAPVPRRDDPRLLTGAGRYVDDITLPGTLHAAFARSPYAHARLRAVNADSAAQLPGVRLVVHGRSAGIAAAAMIEPVVTTPHVRCPPRPLLPGDIARFAGEAVAAVVALTRYQAEDALDALEIEYEPLPVVVDACAALRNGTPQVHPDVPDNCYLDHELGTGAVDQAFAHADVVVDWRRFEHARLCGTPLETRGVLAAPGDDGRLTIWTSSQVPHRVREVVARSLALDEAAVRVVIPDVGGGFGTKAQVYPEEVVVAWLARTLGAPVKWVEDRREHLLAAGHARQQVVEARLAATREGLVTTLDARVLCDIGAYGVYPFGPILEPLGTSAMLPGPYHIRAYRCRVQAALTNKSPEGPYRGVGLPVATFVHERLMDLLAARLGIAPDEVRRRNMVPAGAFPYTTVTGMEYDSGDYAACLQRAVDALDLPYWRRKREEMNALGAEVRLGIGIGCYVEYTGLGAATYRARGMRSVPGFDAARLRVERDGSVTVAASLSEMGQGIQTTLCQLAAAGLDLPLEVVRFANTDTDLAPPGTGTFASRSAILGARALAGACRRLRERILDAAAEALEADPADLVFAEGRVRVQGVPDRLITLADLAARARDPLEASQRDDGPTATFPYASHAAVMEIDTRTGRSRFLAYVVAEDCGAMINPLIVDGQIHGAVAQGIGEALLEQLCYDDQGQLLTGSLMDNLLPSADDVPPLHILHLQNPAPRVPGGFKGVGEGGTLAPPAVVANALSDALGVEVNALPATPQRLLWLWQGAPAAQKGSDGEATPL